MSKMNVGMSGILQFHAGIDYEWQQIIMRLHAYGKHSTGSKSGDIALLHSIEIEKAKLETTVSNKFLTVTREEQEKIQEKKQEKKANVENKQKVPKDDQLGAKLLGEQIYETIKLKKKKVV